MNIAENTVNNYIRIDAEDPENNPFVFEVQVPTAYGELSGTPPTFAYTPDPGFKGTDCFSYIVKDYFGESEPCVVEIVVDDDIMPDHTVKYTTTDYIGISGSFFYSFDDVDYYRGFGGLVTPYTSKTEITLNGTFNNADDGVNGWVLSPSAVIENGNLVLNEGVVSTAGLETAGQGSSYVTGETYRVEIIVEGIQLVAGGGGVEVSIRGTSAPVLDEVGTYEFDIVAGSGTDPEQLVISIQDSAAVIGRIRTHLKVDTTNVYIKSNDHRLDDERPYVSHCHIIKWGIRTDFRDYLLNQTGLAPDGVTLDDDAGHCAGEDFRSCFENTSMTEVPILYLDRMIKTDRMFFGSKIKRVTFDKAAWLVTHIWNSSSEMFMNSDIENVAGMQTYWVMDFRDMFRDSKLICLEYINTGDHVDRNYANKNNMFTGTESTLVKPSVAEVANIIDANGSSFNNPDGCGVLVDGITWVSGTKSCDVSTYGGSCNATSKYTVGYSNNIGGMSFTWAYSNCTKISGGGSSDDWIEVRTSGSVNQTAYLACTVEDAGPPVSNAMTGTYGFTHTRKKTYMDYVLPKKYAQINLKDWIDSKGPTSNEIVIRNNTTNCSVYCNSFPSAWNVTFLNSGRLEGFAKGDTNTNYSTNHGLYIASSSGALKLVNTGQICGAGGYGGRGGKGKNSSYSYYNYEKRYTWKGCNQSTGGNYWVGVIDYNNDHLLTWNGQNSGFVGNIGTNWRTISGLSGHFRKSSYKMTTTCSHYTKFYTIERRTSVTGTYTGGNGGAGGHGAGYGKSDVYNGSWRIGANGKASSPSGGNSGGKGANGGWWGNDGYTGSTGAGGGSTGSTGKNGSPGLYGVGNLTGGSTLGTVYGGTV